MFRSRLVAPVSGGLFDPLGTERAEPGPPFPLAVVLAGAALVGLAALVAVSVLRDDGNRGRPVVVVPIARVEAPPKPSAPPAQAAASVPVLPGPPSSEAVAGAQPDQDVEIQNGVRIVRPRRAAPGPADRAILMGPLPQAR